MESHVIMEVGLTLAVLTVVALAVYRMKQRSRERRVHDWVKAYLKDRYGTVPSSLTINSSGDPLWPVLVTFETPGAATRRYLQFSCGGPLSTFFLSAERVASR